MKEIIIKTQSEIDALPDRFNELTIIRIEAESQNRIIVRKARGNSSVVAWGNSSVEARENSSVVARENSSVVAWGQACIRIQSEAAAITLWGFAVAFLFLKTAKAILKSKTATIITPERKEGTDGWLEDEGIEPADKVILFKRVSSDYKTQEGERWEARWPIGLQLEHLAWEPTTKECGGGKFHACSRPYFCDEFRNNLGDRYIAIEIEKKDLYAWPNPQYPHKIAFRAGKVLYECDKHGRKIEQLAAAGECKK